MRRLTPYLPAGIAKAAVSLPDFLKPSLTEIRLRLNGPVSVTAGGKNRYFDTNGRLCGANEAIVCTQNDINECVSLLTGASLYSRGDELRAGYLPFGEGCRAGICGEAIVRDGVLTGFAKIYSVNLRVSRFIKDFGLRAAEHIAEPYPKGALVYSPPGMGKTTLLRSIAARLSEKYRVALADERCELYVPQLAPGMTDVMRGLKKSEALPMLCRSMSPQFIVCDELAPEDEDALMNAFGSGVCIVASAHADSAESLKNRPFLGRLLKTGAFPILIELEEGFKYTVKEYEE